MMTDIQSIIAIFCKIILSFFGLKTDPKLSMLLLNSLEHQVTYL